MILKFLTPSKSRRSTDHCAILPNLSESVSWGPPPPDVTEDVELSSEPLPVGDGRLKYEERIY